MRRCIERSNGLVPLSPFPSWPDCIINTCGYNFRKGQVKLPKTGALLLSGDAVHFKENWDNRAVPVNNFNRDQTLASMQRMADIMAKEKAQLWINHDKAQTDSLKMAPGFYD